MNETGQGRPTLRIADRWCLCALRWKQAFEVGLAPPVVLECTHARALDFVSLAQLQLADA